MSITTYSILLVAYLVDPNLPSPIIAGFIMHVDLFVNKPFGRSQSSLLRRAPTTSGPGSNVVDGG